MNDTDFHQNDELEQHLRSSLHSYAPEAPERLWSGIEAQLPQRRRRPAMLWWLTTVGMSVLLTGVTYWIYHNWNYQESSCGKRSSGDLQPSASLVRKMPSDDLRPIVLVERQKVNTGTLIPQTRRNASSELPMVGGIADVNADAKENSERITVEVSTSKSNQVFTANAVSEKTLSEPNIISKKYDLLALEALPGKSLMARRNDVPVLQPVQSGIKTLHESRWQIGAFAGPVWQWQASSLSGAHHGGHTAFAEYSDGPATGWQAGISANFVLTPRWRISAGLGQRTTAQTSSHHATLRLMDGICLNPNDYGPKEYEFVYALMTGGSTANVTVRIAQVDNQVTMPDDEPFTLAMRTTRWRNDWVVPLALQHIFGRGRWQGFLQAGGQLSLPADNNVRVEHFTEQCADLCFATGRIPELTLEERRHVSLSWLLGMGLEYRVVPRWGLTLAPAVFGNKGQTGIALNTGLHYKF